MVFYVCHCPILFVDALYSAKHIYILFLFRHSDLYSPPGTPQINDSKNFILCLPCGCIGITKGFQTFTWRLCNPSRVWRPMFSFSFFLSLNNKENFIIHASARKSKNTDVYRKNLLILIFFSICDLVHQWEVVWYRRRSSFYA